MTLELADRSITYPKGLAKDVYVKVRKKFVPPLPADFRSCRFRSLIPEYLLILRSAIPLQTPPVRAVLFEFTLKKIDAFSYDKSISLESNHDDCDPEEEIYVLKQLLNDDPFQLPPIDLKQSEVTEAKSLIEEPPELELKDLPSHLEYAFLEENDKLPLIHSKEV
ncbi:hypothetical protein Tco_1194894 [Tanacetum coccineum]